MKRILPIVALLLIVLALFAACGKKKVTFNSNGGSTVVSQSVEKGGKVTLPADPERTGYQFAGWTYQGEAWSFIGYTVTEDITLDANWTPIYYPITYELNGGYEYNNVRSYTIETEDFTLQDPSKSDYEFLGWTWEGQNEPTKNVTISKGSYGEKTFTANWAMIVYVTSGNTITGLTATGRGLTTLEIPSEIDGVAITSIGERAFSSCSGLTSVTIPNSVTSIGSSAFSGCSGLTSITIPSGVTSIGNYAFYSCSGLESITVASGNPNYYSAGNCIIETATQTLIRGCKSSVIPADVKSIGEGAFQYCDALASITIPKSVTSIEGYAFWNCSRLTSITIGNSVTSIGDYAFDGCSGLESISVESWNTKYHSAGNCLIETASKTLILGCKNSVIPTDGSVTSIGSFAFSGCSGLTSIEIPNSVTSIGGWAFSGCPIETATIPAIACRYVNNNNLKTVVITSGTRIEEGAFSGCSGLTSVTIGNSVTSIGERAFYGCSGLTSVTFENTRKWYAATRTWSGVSNVTEMAIANASINATNLKSNYCNYLWYMNT